jgi:glucosamine--fructose-6-phosphate aminotransferase (isomerizing)
MCGIFGLVPGSKLHNGDLRKLRKLINQSERRGSDSSGLLIAKESSFLVSKNFKRISEWSDTYIKSFGEEAKAFFGHTRLATHGDDSDRNNNQPVISNDWCVFHNGIVTNFKDFVSPQLVDTFAIAEVLNNCDSLQRITKQIEVLEGEISFVAIKSDGQVIVYSNVGGLFFATSKDGGTFFASERNFLTKLGLKEITQIDSDSPLCFDLATQGVFTLTEESDPVSKRISIESRKNCVNTTDIQSALLSRIPDVIKIARCSTCLLPANFPGVSFDSLGRCSLCVYHTEPVIKGEAELIKDLTTKQDSKIVLVNLSGGRDSCYALDKVVKLGFTPIAFTYDWGFVSTAARENMARICGKLNVQHIVVSPNIEKNRRIVKSVLSAWLTHPHPGTIPILMAGDKPLLRWSIKISEENNSIPIVHGDHSLENTYFKSALAGAKISYGSGSSKVSYRLDVKSLVRMTWSYLKLISKVKTMRFEVFRQVVNSAFIYYGPTYRFVSIFEYIPWQEDAISDSLATYDWSTNTDATKNKWRMGDSTAPLYNLLYQLTVGFTENDSLLSNQIRAGLISRGEGLNKLEAMNRPDLEGVESYLELIGYDTSAFWRQLSKVKKL